jgi:hypothetical protein
MRADHFVIGRVRSAGSHRHKRLDDLVHAGLELRDRERFLQEGKWSRIFAHRLVVFDRPSLRVHRDLGPVEAAVKGGGNEARRGPHRAATLKIHGACRVTSCSTAGRSPPCARDTSCSSGGSAGASARGLSIMCLASHPPRITGQGECDSSPRGRQRCQRHGVPTCASHHRAARPPR